jgi:hypothetical protein
MRKYLPIRPENKYRFLGYIIIVIVSLFFRLVWLDRIPVGISDDELEYVFNSKAVMLSGHDITGTWNPVSLTSPSKATPMAELPYLIIAPITGNLPFTLFNARLPYAIANTILVLATALIAATLINPTVGFITGIFGAVNPWNLYFGRTAYDSPLATLFMYLAVYLTLTKTKWKQIGYLIFYFLAFYCYIGIKTVFIPFVGFISVWNYLYFKRKYLKELAMTLIFAALIFGFFLANLKTNSASGRLPEIFTPSHFSVTKQVNDSRRNSINSPLQSLYDNKIIVYAKTVLSKYFNFFYPEYLFINGEGRSTYSVWGHGVMYFIDMVFIVLGLIFLYRKNKFVLFFLSGLLLLSPIPTVFSSVGISFSIRSALAFPPLIILAATGFYFLNGLPRSIILKRYSVILTSLVYAVFVSNFLYSYFLKNPVSNSEGFAFSERQIANYIRLSKTGNQKIVIMTDGSQTLLRQYLFFSDLLNKTTYPEISRAFRTGIFSYGNISSTSCGDSWIFDESTVYITHAGSVCPKLMGKKYYSLALLSDGGEIYRIYNDKICGNYQLGLYPGKIEYRYLVLENLNIRDFCQKYVTDLSPILPKSADVPETE